MILNLCIATQTEKYLIYQKTNKKMRFENEFWTVSLKELKDAKP